MLYNSQAWSTAATYILYLKWLATKALFHILNQKHTQLEPRESEQLNMPTNQQLWCSESQRI
jgi:hypothetical protein